MFPKIGVPPNHSFFRVFHYKPSILGYHYFWKHPYLHCKRDDVPNLQLASPIFEVALERSCSLRKSPLNSCKSDFLPRKLHPNPYINGSSSSSPDKNPKSAALSRSSVLKVDLTWRSLENPRFFLVEDTSTHSWLGFSASHASFLFGVHILLGDDYIPKARFEKCSNLITLPEKKRRLCFQGIQPLPLLQSRSWWWFWTIWMMFPPSETSRFMSTYCWWTKSCTSW